MPQCILCPMCGKNIVLSVDLRRTTMLNDEYDTKASTLSKVLDGITCFLEGIK